MIVLVGFLLMLIAPVPTLAQSPADLDFQARCKGPGVLRCVDFDTPAWIPRASSVNLDRGYNFGLLSGQDPARVSIDTTVKASGTGSLRHTFKAGLGNSDVLDFVAHFRPCPGAGNAPINCTQPNYPDPGGQTNPGLNPGDAVYIQWRARYDSNMVNHANFLGNDPDGIYRGNPVQNWGFKFADLGLADLAVSPNAITSGMGCRPSGTGGTKSQSDNNAGVEPNGYDCPTSCSAQAMELVMTGGLNDSTILAYGNCSTPIGSPSVAFQGFIRSLNNGSNWSYQGEIASCTNANGYAGCRKIVPNEWLTFKMYFKMGHFNQFDSEFKFWFGRQGQPLEKLIDCSAAGPNKCDFSWPGQANNGIYMALMESRDFVANFQQQVTGPWKIGKIHLLPYTTGLVSAVADASMWYDELIISTQDIADPGSATGPAIPPMAPANLRVQ